MKKVLFVMDQMVSGGSQKILVNCLNLFLEDYDVDLLLINNYGVYLDEIPKNVKVYSIFPFYKQVPLSDLKKYSFFEKLKIIYYKLFFRNSVYLKYIKYKSNNIIGNEYDYIIGFQEGPSNYIVANLKKKSYKIAWLHSDIFQLNQTQTKMEVGVYENIDTIICVSDFVKAKAMEKYSYISDKLRVLYNPIDIKDILEKASENTDDILKEKINIISIGRLSPEKNYSLLIESLKEILIENDYLLHIIGDGKERENLNNIIRNNNLESYVKLHGFQSNPYKFLSRSNIYISSSLYEGLPTTILESMILGKKIIANNIPSNKELLNDYLNSEIVDINNKEEIRLAIERLLKKDKVSDLKYIKNKISNETFLSRFKNTLNH